MKINGNEKRPGNVIRHKDVIWIAIKISHVKPGKGGAFAQVELKKVSDGTKLNERFRSSETVERLRLESKKYQFLFLEDKTAHFMDNETFEQISLSKIILDDIIDFLIENTTVDILFDGESPLEVRIPLHMNLLVKETEPGEKGNTAQGATKPAI